MRGPVSSSGPVPRGPVVSGPVVKFILILLSQCFDFTLFCVCNSLFVLLLFLVYHTDYNRSTTDLFLGKFVFCFSLFFDYSISHTLQQKYNKINLFRISIFNKCLDFGLFNMAKGGGVSKRNIENSKENLFFLLYYYKKRVVVIIFEIPQKQAARNRCDACSAVNVYIRCDPFSERL